MKKLLIIKTDSGLKPDTYQKTYNIIENMVNNNILLLDKRFNYEVVEVGKIILDNRE